MILYLLMAILSPVSSHIPPSNRIVGGENATEGEFPFMLSLQMIPVFGEPYHFCGGAIYNASHVVTTALCVLDRQLDQVDIVAGAFNLSSSPLAQHRLISSLTFHPLFDSITFQFDIALITLNEPFQFTPQIQPMPLPPPSFQFMGNCTVPGWGSVLPLPLPSLQDSQLLHKVNMSLVSSQTCQTIYEFIHLFDPSSMICATGHRDDMSLGPCVGDSGSPLICKHIDEAFNPVVAGIMSFSMLPCGDSSYPSIYTNISALSAIIENIHTIN